MILKSGQIDSRFKASQPDIWCALVFGEDDGVVSDTADGIVGLWTKHSAGGCQQVTIDDDDIRREPHILSDRIETSSLLGETECIRIRTSGEKISKPVLDLLEKAEKLKQPFDNKLIILNGALNKRSKLRTTIEAAQTAAAVHVFADTQESLQSIVRSSLSEFQVEIEDDALADFIALLPGHRGLANQETEKLALYGRGLGRPVNLEDIRVLCQTDADNNVRDMVQAALDGNGARCQAELDRVSETGSSSITVLRSLEMEAKRLLQARGLIGSGGDIGRKLRPPVWTSEWPAFRSRMDLWTATSLTRLLAAIHDLELQAKTSGPASDPALRILLLNVVKSASARSGR
ncbi:DNA polymerase III subunit delta [Henriciella litoralis]|uniref:DNA polymerase III subunit delta n=1 Tax=Henriciella litoralis TaxID=568102 RepID=UPI0009FDDF0C|nr:DNA polymerase III subunit delta [Henriciella litoralis]